MVKPRPTEPYIWRYDFIVPLRLYMDDIHDLFAVVRQIGPVSAETDTHTEITSFDEVRQLEGKPLKTLKVMGVASEGKSIEAEFGPSGASITITDPAPAFTGALHQIQSIAWRHWRNFSLADIGVWLFVYSLVFAIVALQTDWRLAVAIVLVTAIGALIGVRERRNRWTIMPMVWYAARPDSFAKRNRDQIILGVIFTILGAVLGVALTLAVQQFLS